MSLSQVSEKQMYLAVSTDISSGKIPGASNIGWQVYTTDNSKFYIVGSDLNLIEAASSSVSLGGGESYVGQIGGKSNVLSQTLVLDTSVYASGDVLSITVEVPSFFRVNGGTAIILGASLLDEDKQVADLDILLFNAMTNIGTINNPYDITTAEASTIIGRFVFTSADYTTWTNFSTAFLGLGDPGFKARVVKGASNSRSIWIASIIKSVKTYTASGSLKLSIQYVMD